MKMQNEIDRTLQEVGTPTGRGVHAVDFAIRRGGVGSPQILSLLGLLGLGLLVLGGLRV
jgi:hypothetical protein